MTKLKVSGLAQGDSVAKWESSNTKIFKVTGNAEGSCKITAGKKTGKAMLTITLASGKQTKVTIKVQKTAVKTKKITGVSSKLTLKKGKKAKLAASVTPISSKQKVTYTSSNKKVVTVTSKGIVKAKKKGKAKRNPDIHTLLIGTGPDTFVLAFPQDDYRMRLNTGWRMLNEIPSKAHSLYLQSALQTGICSLVCLLVFWGKYLMGSFRGFWKKSQNAENPQNPGLFVGILGYLLMGMLNDSVVAVAPVFWALLGIGMASVTRRDEKKTKKIKVTVK